MDYSPWSHKELDMTEQLSVSLQSLGCLRQNFKMTICQTQNCLLLSSTATVCTLRLIYFTFGI